MRLVNLTPHRLCVLDGEVVIIDLPGTSSPARVSEHVEAVPALRTGTPEVYVPAVLISQSPRIVNLPDPEPGVEFVVSRITAAACSRPDVLFPYDEVRDRDGRIVGCRALARFDRHPGEPRA